MRYSSIYAGEWYDASFVSAERPVVKTAPHWDVPLVKQEEGTMVKVRQELPSSHLGGGLYDLGQNSSGIVRIKVKGKKGQTITLRPSEILRNSAIAQTSLPGYEWKYTLRGDRKGEVWQPHSTLTE